MKNLHAQSILRGQFLTLIFFFIQEINFPRVQLSDNIRRQQTFSIQQAQNEKKYPPVIDFHLSSYLSVKR